jgi:MoxR-like ATPase
MTALDQRVRRTALTFGEQLREIEDAFVARREAVQLLGLGALCREHVLLLGPPGTAKTRLVERFCRTLDTRPFSYLLTRFTEPAEIFGPIDVKSFTQESRYQVNTEGMLPQARVAFLDEVFQGSSAILNTLLTLINERTFRDGRPGSDDTTPLVTLVGSSNEIPNDPVLAAFSDRFLLRCRVRYVGLDQLEDVLLLGWKDEQQQIRQDRDPADPASRMRVSLSETDLRTLHGAVAQVDLSPVTGTYLEILREIRGAGIKFSDRRAVKAQKVFAASALLAGRAKADVTDLRWLANLWTDETDEESLRKLVAGHGVPVEEPAERVRDLHDIIDVDLATLRARVAQVATEPELRKLTRDTQRLAGELRRDHPAASDELARVQAVQREILTVLRERFPWRGTELCATPGASASAPPGNSPKPGRRRSGGRRPGRAARPARLACASRSPTRSAAPRWPRSPVSSAASTGGPRPPRVPSPASWTAAR